MAYLLVTEAVGSSGTARFSLIDVPSRPQLAVYAIWDTKLRNNGLARLAVLNLEMRNQTASTDEATAVAVTLDVGKYAQQGREPTVKRMTAPGLDSKDSTRVTWAGQSYANGTPSGTKVVESLQGGKVTVQGSEGILVFFA